MTIALVNRGLVAATAATLLLLTACTAGGDDATDSATGGASSGELQAGPLEEYLAKVGSFGGSSTMVTVERSQDEQNEAEARAREIESLVAACMSEQGFDYTPPGSPGAAQAPGGELDVEWGSREFAEKYGYGISTDPWGLGDAGTVGTAGGGAIASDANQELLAQMTDSERAAFEEALYGAPMAELMAQPDGDFDWRNAGCLGAAQHEVFGAEGTTQDDTRFNALQDEIAEFWQSVESSREKAAIEGEWATCMADAGHAGMTVRQEAVQTMATAFTESFPDGTSGAGVSQAELDTFRQDEIEQAVADWTCADDMSFDKRLSESSHRLQQAFVDEHKAELEAWVESVTEAGR